MTDYPDFSENNYQIISELGRNSIGGRVTYLARETNTQQQVVIKQFQFAKMGATWAEYEAYEQEIAMLRHLNHPGIPRYLDSFQTADGFCMVQEYINAQSLAVSRSWSPQEIKRVAIATLEILIYLQSLNPSVIHRDLKPENILADKNLNIYLVDFGFARLGGGEIAASSVVKGTMGFMPPEQLFNRQLTTASDLYGLGATLICLLTGIKSANIGNLIDENYRIQFQHLVPPLKRGLISWLEKISEPNPSDRYANAAEALEVLKSLDVDRLPKVRVNRNNLEFVAEEFRQKVTETITISNPIPETVLTGRWEVASHQNDPPHTPYDHGWIEFDSYKFEGNEVECKITVDTSKLLAEESYNRELLLHSNSEGESLVIPVEVKTAAMKKFDYPILILTAIVLPFLLFMPGIALTLPILERILKANAKGEKIDEFAVLSFSLISLILFVMAMSFFYPRNSHTLMGVIMLLFFPYEELKVASLSLLLFKVVIVIFALGIILNLGAAIATNSSMKNKEKQKLFFAGGKFLLIILLSLPIAFLLVLSLLVEPVVAKIVFMLIRNPFLFWCVLSLLVNYQNKGFFLKHRKTNSMANFSFSLSLVFACLLAASLLKGSISNLNLEEMSLIAVVAIAPVLFYGSSLMLVKRWRAIARYNREKPNLIKP